MEFLHWDLKSVGLYWILLILCLKEDIMVLNVCVKFEVHWNYASRVTGPNIIYTILHEVELMLRKMVGWLVRLPNFSLREIGSLDFSDFLHGVRV